MTTETLGGGGAGGGAFTSQLETELREHRIDVAIHSLKDLPTQSPEGLALATTPGPRADLREALVGASLGALRYGARGEVRPTLLLREPSRLEHLAFVDCIDAGPLSGL